MQNQCKPISQASGPYASLRALSQGVHSQTRRDGVKRTVFETALIMAVLVLGLEVIHYRNAVLDANVDRNRAWKTVIDLRHKCESASTPAASSPGSTGASR